MSRGKFFRDEAYRAKMKESLERSYKEGRSKRTSPSAAMRQRISASLKGRPLSAETRAKMSLARTKEKHHGWKGGVAQLSTGYEMVRIGKQEYQFTHRAVMEQVVGRVLKKREVVHHWDEKKGNNDPNNLALFRHHPAHVRLHLFAKRHNIPVEALKFDQPWLDYEAQFQPQ